MIRKSAFVALCATILLSSSTPAALLDGLAAHWSFDGNATDSVGSNDASLLNGAGYDTGKYGSALRLDGINDYGVVNSFSLGGPQTGLTLSVWVNMDINQNQHYVLDGRTGGATYYLNFSQTFIQYPNNNPSGLSLSVGNWHHLLVTSDNTGSTFYIDGAVVATGGAGIPATTTSHLDIGRRFNSQEYLDGRIDDLAFWNRSLNASEVSEVFNLQNGLANAASSVATLPSLALMLMGLLGIRVIRLNVKRGQDRIPREQIEPGPFEKSPEAIPC